MNFKIGTFFLVVILFISSCTEQDEIDIEEISKLENEVSKMLNSMNDTVRNGLSRYYYSNGELHSIINRKNGEKEGWCKFFYENGNLKIKALYRDDVPNGVNYEYYEDGKSIKAKSFWLDNQSFGATEWFSKSGEIEMFNSTDFFGKTFFVVKWDEDGNQIKFDGRVFSPVLKFSEVEPNIKVDEEIIIKIAVATPPNTNTIMRVGWLSEDTKEIDIVDYAVTYPVTFEVTGKYTLVTIGELFDMKGNLLQRDSVATDISVGK